MDAIIFSKLNIPENCEIVKEEDFAKEIRETLKKHIQKNYNFKDTNSVFFYDMLVQRNIEYLFYSLFELIDMYNKMQVLNQQEVFSSVKERVDFYFEYFKTNNYERIPEGYVLKNYDLCEEGIYKELQSIGENDVK